MIRQCHVQPMSFVFAGSRITMQREALWTGLNDNDNCESGWPQLIMDVTTKPTMTANMIAFTSLRYCYSFSFFIRSLRFSHLLSSVLRRLIRLRRNRLLRFFGSYLFTILHCLTNRLWNDKRDICQWQVFINRTDTHFTLMHI